MSYSTITEREKPRIKQTKRLIHARRKHDQYVKFFKENIPHILKAIMEHRNNVAAYSNGEKKKDFTQTNGEENDDEDNTDYNFYYENNPDWNKRIGAGTFHIGDASSIQIVTVLISLENTKDLVFFIR